MRTLEEIRASAIGEKDKHPELSILDSISKTAIWNLWLDILIVICWVQEGLWEKRVLDIENLVRNQPVGSSAWYIEQAKAFQYSQMAAESLLTVVNGRVVYESVNSDAQIITQVALKEQLFEVDSEQVFGLLVKVAKGLAPNLEPLSAMELNTFRVYMNRVRFMGTYLEVLSQAADKLRLSGEIRYSGTRTDDSVRLGIEVAIKGFYLNLPFDGSLLISRLIDAIQSLQGIEDVYLTQVNYLRADESTGEVIRVDLPVSGYYTFDDATIEGLSLIKI